MPKSNRCGECGLPIKGHKRRTSKNGGRAITVKAKIKKNGARRSK